MSNFEGAMLSDYLLLQCISRGGVADVYRARQTGEGKYEVAVKIFRQGYAQRSSFRDYFLNEAEKVGHFDHPNILPFLEFGEGDGLLYAVTPFVTGGTLNDLLTRVGGRFSAMQVLPIMQQLCSAVQYAHEREVIHGNIKPSNIFVATDGRMLLSDFGIARGYDDSQHSLTRVGWGSAEYAAPEQSLGVLRPASDIYTLGVLLFRILTGHAPFTGQTPVEVLLKHVRQQPPSARTFDPSISDAVDDVLRKAMQKRSDDRFVSAEEFSRMLQGAVAIAPIASPVARATSPSPRQLLPDSLPDISNPQTPVPANIVFTPPPVNPSLPQGQISINSPSEQPVRQPSPTQDSTDMDPAADVTEIRRKSFLEENDDGGINIFWSADPLEWSPVADKGDGSAPLTAAEYLSSKQVVPQVEPQGATPPDERSQKSGAISPESDQSGDSILKVPEKAKAKSKFGKKILPILVIILLLIGLLGALLSSFLFPGPSNNNSGHAQPAATASLSFLPDLADPRNKSVVPFKNLSHVALESQITGPEV